MTGKPRRRKNPKPGLPPARAGGKKLYTCANKKCPNRSHHTPSCPNLSKRNISQSSPTFPPPVVSCAVTEKNTRPAAELSGNASGGEQTPETFDRSATDTGGLVNPPGKTWENGTMEWADEEGETHRDNDLPAVVFADGTQQWWWHGKQHRDNDLPAIIYADGTKVWWRHGELHRDGDRPAILYPDGSQGWWLHNQLHRMSGPAFIHRDGTREWWQYDKLHRVSGPAIVRPGRRREWWVAGIATERPDLCEQAYAPARTSEERNKLAELCLHDDPVVAAVAAHNPDCPEEGTTAYYLKH